MRTFCGEVSRALTVGLTLVPGFTWSAEHAGGARAARPTSTDIDNLSGDTCWVFTHMNKSGGTTVKRLLRPSLDKNGIKYGLFDNAQWKKGVDYLRNDYLERGTQLTWGGYTEGERGSRKRW